MATFIEEFDYVDVAKSRFHLIHEVEAARRKNMFPVSVSIDYTVDRFKKTLETLKEIPLVLSDSKEIMVPVEVEITDHHATLRAEVPDEYELSNLLLTHVISFENDDIWWTTKFDYVTEWA